MAHPLDAIDSLATSVARGVGSALDTGRDATEGLARKALGLVPDRIVLRGDLPPYPVLPAAARAMAQARSAGMTAPQPVIRDGGGKPHEPVNLYVAANRDDLVAALESRGWKRAHEMSFKAAARTAASILDKLSGGLVGFNYKQSPVSDQYLDGERHLVAYNKNNVHDLSRDHLRIWDTGRKNPGGKPIWAIAATRDTHMNIRPRELGGGHAIDRRIDGERDLVMADFLASSRVADWRIARGIPPEAERGHLASRYVTDGNVYLVELAPRG